MTANPLPLILSLPHGGLAVPTEMAAQIAVTDTVVYNECDLWVEQLYDFQAKNLTPLTPAGYTAGVLAQVTMPIARVFIDANRAPDDLQNPDGPVKTLTSYGQAIYQPPLNEHQQRQLLETYWQPYHRRLEAAIQNYAGQAKLFLDCHNMAQHGPTAYDFPGAPRPLLCLANLGDATGEPQPNLGWTTCSADLLREAGRLAHALFADLTLLEPKPQEQVPVVALNWPFAGGYICRRYARPNLPGLMVEVNRGLFVGDQQTDTPIQPPNQAQIALLRQRLYQWVVELVKLL